MAAAIPAGRDQVCAFRLSGHHLDHRMGQDQLVEAAAACGLQDSPPGSAALALNARLDGLGLADLTQALETDKTLLRLRSLRAAPHLVPTRDAAVFTSALLPETEEELRFFIRGASPALDKAGISAGELVELTAAALLAALDGRTLAFRALSADLNQRVAAQLAGSRLAAWQSPGWYAPQQSLGEALVHFALYPLALRGLWCFAPRQGDEAALVRIDRWLGRPLPALAPEQAQAELLRRYLRGYGPSTVQHFAEWAGVAPAFAERAWARVKPELVEVAFDGRRAWLHAADLRAFADPPAPTGVRLLPPHDPYLAQRDRATLLPDTALHRQIWRPTGNPGVVLAGGTPVALWRPQKKGPRLRLTVEPFAALGANTRSEIAAEAARMAPWRECTAGDVVFAG